jgi:hypothetical protein
VITSSLTQIFNQSLLTGVFPDDFKVTIISPIFKSESKLECNNYRPLSVLSVVAKVLKNLYQINCQQEAYSHNNRQVLGRKTQQKHRFKILLRSGLLTWTKDI